MSKTVMFPLFLTGLCVVFLVSVYGCGQHRSLKDAQQNTVTDGNNSSVTVAEPVSTGEPCDLTAGKEEPGVRLCAK